ncbi:MAG: hypothetical protein MUF49_15410 [Oculatellaceae cyanobacterium Prado106]|nr:hypothetical protein [Oculatellaceae cyanobacterium Prado106]
MSNGFYKTLVYSMEFATDIIYARTSQKRSYFRFLRDKTGINKVFKILQQHQD